MLDRLPRLGPRTKRWLHNYLRGRYVRVCAREQHSRKQLTSTGVPQGSVPGPQLFLYCVDDLLRRLHNIYSASAFMYADEHTLVASGADIHACAAAMQPALSLITKWATEHNLKISADRSEPLYSATPHTGGLTRTPRTVVWAMETQAGGPTRCVCPEMRLIGPSILVCTPPPLQGRSCHAAISRVWSYRWARPITPCDPFWSHTFIVCYFITVGQFSRTSLPPASIMRKYGTAEVVKRPLAQAHIEKIRLSTWNPIFSRSGRYFGSVRSRNANAIHASTTTGICVPLSTRNRCRLPCMGKRRHRSRFREMLLLMDCNASV
ncbi:hypothetical protein C3747_78g188 [Trypanosoma cruzi]|uniref:Reverse transcriptase domain-containing protein n=1 Tax=Trypanosoma cruzi TaxID=5693 RepID=A0A2V2WLK3_TRYCR|nr:hypothetical protein - Trypanosoma cruzi [Trypanosoma cruzi]PWV09490.1 hypothetical protein C3747_78g188 [Trypanosoma cruzi]